MLKGKWLVENERNNWSSHRKQLKGRQKKQVGLRLIEEPWKERVQSLLWDSTDGEGMAVTQPGSSPNRILIFMLNFSNHVEFILLNDQSSKNSLLWLPRLRLEWMSNKQGAPGLDPPLAKDLDKLLLVIQPPTHSLPFILLSLEQASSFSRSFHQLWKLGSHTIGKHWRDWWGGVQLSSIVSRLAVFKPCQLSIFFAWFLPEARVSGKKERWWQKRALLENEKTKRERERLRIGRCTAELKPEGQLGKSGWSQN